MKNRLCLLSQNEEAACTIFVSNVKILKNRYTRWINKGFVFCPDQNQGRHLKMKKLYFYTLITV
ncbi:hypothetical protein SAMN02745124_04415 [Desulfofustis glycolicus DSM 9705]|uniref:Uncharacterized protein n=1 Tax=Desulfofustis glycolicus DSM 9705 TaxID=1121409 RepID=A0A1M5YSQ4_9BACT|nr:hypothetical protein SAMN02745124_04415 [Desulfofustis glycolicus DSM 9705]